MTMFYLRTWKKGWSYRMKVRIFDHSVHRRMLAMVAIPKVCFRDLVTLVIWHQRRSSFAPYLFGSGRLGGGGGCWEWKFCYSSRVSQSWDYKYFSSIFEVSDCAKSFFIFILDIQINLIKVRIFDDGKFSLWYFLSELDVLNSRTIIQLTDIVELLLIELI